MTRSPAEAQRTELEQAAADRRSFGNTDLAANAEFKVIAEAMRELVAELRLIRKQVEQLASVASRDVSVAPLHSAKTPSAKLPGAE